MESDDLKPHIPRKRSRSPSLISDVAAPRTAGAGPTTPEDPAYMHRQPKRQRKNKDIPEYDEQPDKHVLGQMGKSNPLNRKALKKDAKRQRKMAKMQSRAEAANGGGGMQIDGDDLQFTFMA
jgi:nuclear GTP-binding protein